MSDIKCFHCDLPVPSKTVYQLMIFNDMRRMCCPGCLAIAEFICSNGLDDYYHYRDRPALKGDEVIPKELSIFDTYDSNSLQQSVISHDKAGISKITLTIEGISCAACTWLIERHIKAIPGIRSFFVNLSTSKAQVSWDKKQLPLSKLLLEFTRIGYKASPYTVQKQEQLHQQEYKKGLQKIIIAGIGMMQVMMLAVALYLGKAGDLAVHHWVFIRFISFIVATFVLFFAAQDFFYSAWRSLKAKTLGMDVPISLSLGIAYCASIYNTIHNAGDIYFDSVCMFTFFLLVSRFLEMRARHRSCNTIYALQKLTVGMTTVVGIDHMEIKMPVNDLNIDDHILVKPGELIPVDGVVLEGDSCVDEAMLTGESYPASKKIGNTVLGGTYNIENALLIKVSKKAINSKFSTIVQLLEQAGSAKPSITNLADKVTGYFVMVVLLLTLVVSMIWLYVDTQNVLKIILSMLVITCPCALSLATPVAVTNCTNYLVKIGYLITKGHVLESLSQITDIVFDKTGTLTENKFSIQEIATTNGVSEDKAFAIALALEEKSSHPIATAFTSCLINKSERLIAENVKSYVNNGMEGDVEGKRYRIGASKFVTENIESSKSSRPGMWIALSEDGETVAWFRITSQLRTNIIPGISLLKK